MKLFRDLGGFVNKQIKFEKKHRLNVFGKCSFSS